MISIGLSLALSACGSDTKDTVEVITEEVKNSIPAISSTGILTVKEGTAYSYTLASSDSDGDPLTLSASTLPAWLSFDGDTGILSGTPEESDVGEHPIILTVSDGTDDLIQSFTIAVTAADVIVPENNAAVISSTEITGATVGTAYSYTLTATDTDNDDLTMSVTVPTALSWLTFDAATGILSGTPASGDIATTEITLTVNDGTADTTQTFNITVADKDAPLVFGDNLLTNSNFDASTADWNGGTIIYKADVAVAGNPYDVNLSHGLTLIAGDTYTLKFDGKSSVDRAIVAGIGFYHDPWTNDIQDVDLTTAWQSFSLDFTATAGDDNSRTIFDMGAAVGDVSLKNMQLLDSSDTDLVLTSTPSYGSGNNYYYAEVAAAGNPYDVNLSQVMTITPGETYQISFKAKASVARNIIAGVGLNAAPWDNRTETVALTTDWADYTITVVATTEAGADFGDDNSRVLFDMGAEIGNVMLDDIEVKMAGGAEAPTSNFVAVGTPYDFEAAGLGSDFTWAVFENEDNAPLEFVANPASSSVNDSAMVAMFTAKQAGQAWAGTETTAANTTAFTMDATNSIVKIMVYKSVISDVALKFSVGAAAQAEIKVANTKINEWEELTFDFSGRIGLAETINIDSVIVFPDFDANRAGDNVTYFDNITFGHNQ